MKTIVSTILLLAAVTTLPLAAAAEVLKKGPSHPAAPNLTEYGKAVDIIFLHEDYGTAKPTYGLSTGRLSPSSFKKTAESMAFLFSMALIDYNQSVDMFFREEGYVEINPILGAHPSRSEMAAFGLISVGLTYLLIEVLPERWRRVAIDSIIASEKMNIEENRRVYQGWNTGGPPLRGRALSGIPLVLSFRF